MSYLYRITLCTIVALISVNLVAQENRAYDGKENNVDHPEWGSAKGPIIHALPVAFEDGISEPNRADVMNPRSISNRLFHQIESTEDHLGLSDFTWAFGQFIDHDITLIENFPASDWTESVSIVVPQDDQWMTPGKIIPVMRSHAEEGTGTDVSNPRSYVNEITAFLDASAVYGSDEARAKWLRTFRGGMLKTSRGNLLPWNTIDGDFNSPVDPDAPFMGDDVGQSAKLFVAGDVRANENPLLLSLHLLFVREHNRLCQEWIDEDPNLDPTNPFIDEELYQRARKVVGGMLQHIVYEEWLPTIGIDLGDYRGYDAEMNPCVTNTFSAAAFRWGHTMINDMVMRVEMDGETSELGNISLKDAFFNPLESLRLPVEVYFKGMGVQMQQNLDCQLVNSVRNFLFEHNSFLGGLDLAAINIQRGRERGLMDYNSLRETVGFQPRTAFNQICENGEVTAILEEIYGSLDKIDPWVGLLAEDPIEGSIFGEVVHKLVAEQFEAIRTGDRYYYLNDAYIFPEDMELINSTTMSELIMRNTEIECFQENAFETTPHDEIPCFPYVAPSDLSMTVTPNPVSTETFVSLFSKKDVTAYARIVNQAGQVISEREIDLEKGENRFTMDWTSIETPGSYYLMLEREYDIIAAKLLKL